MQKLKFQPDARSYVVNIVIFSAIYTLYGQHVCPILNSKDFFGVLVPCATVLLGLFVVRNAVMSRLDLLPSDRNLRWSFWADFALFLIGGLIVSVFNRMYFNVPLENTFKVGVSFIALGYYIVLDLSLQRERRLARRIISGDTAFPKNGKSMPVTRKFLLFSILNLIILAVVCVLVVYKDLLIFGRTGFKDVLILSILLEVSFVLVVIGGYISCAIMQYSRNLKLSLQIEHETLIAVSEGDLQNRAAITSMDEFGAVAHLTNQMIEKLEASIENLNKSQNSLIVSLVALAAKRDNETGLHLRRTQHYISALAETLRKHPGHRLQITKECVDLLYQAAPLHDIGKVGIPDAILQKPGPLDHDEFEVMKTHTTIGAAALEDAEEQLDDSKLICMAREIVISHHEKWDGSGYPFGLAGTDIPLSGRLMAVADVYDALRSKRVYKPAMSHQQALNIIKDDAGTHFDPAVVEAFLECENQFEEIASSLQDETPNKSDADVTETAQNQSNFSNAA